jgi:uncharacterized protein (DUF427 family)
MYNGCRRPPFAEEPGPRRESVWDYPRPPAICKDSRRVTVKTADFVLVDSHRAIRILETASPPTFYIPPEDVDTSYLIPCAGSSYCEWKGLAQYWSLSSPGREVQQAGWSYPQPNPDFAQIAGYFAFYPGKLECYVDGERVHPQPGGFYGGWLTGEIAGPVKGLPGTHSW